MVRRAAFTLIELVLAIVIIAISVLSIPMITQIESATQEKNIAQEAVYAASAKLLQVLSYQWDENSADPVLVQEGATVIAGAVRAGNTASLDYNATDCRPGFVSRTCRRLPNTTPVSTTGLGDDIADPIRGIDDRGGNNIALDNAGTSAAGYKKAYVSDLSVAYIADNANTAGGTINYNAGNPFGGNGYVFSDAAVAGPTNMKMITLTIKENNTPITTLRSYAANIGEVKYYNRAY